MKKYPGLFFGLITVLLLMVSNFYPVVADTIYYRYIFQAIRIMYDYSFGLLPFPVVTLLSVVLVYCIARFLKRIQRTWNRTAIVKSLSTSILQLISFVGMIAFAFYLLWGLNYKRTPIDQELGLDFNASIADEDILKEADIITDLLLNERNKISLMDSISRSELPSEMESEIRFHLSQVLSDMEYRTLGRPRVRRLQPKGLYLEFRLRVYIFLLYVKDISMPDCIPIQHPYTMAHEMTHAFGFTDEGVCNFIALLACLQSDRPYIGIRP